MIIWCCFLGGIVEVNVINCHLILLKHFPVAILAKKWGFKNLECKYSR